MTVIRLIKGHLLPAKQACISAPYVICETDLDLIHRQARDREWTCSISESATGNFGISIT